MRLLVTGGAGFLIEDLKVVGFLGNTSL